MLTKRQKRPVIDEHAVHETDTGSAPVQIALITKRIAELAAHLKQHPKDHHSRRGLLKLVGKRRRLLTYLAKHDSKKHAAIRRSLGIKA